MVWLRQASADYINAVDPEHAGHAYFAPSGLGQRSQSGRRERRVLTGGGLLAEAPAAEHLLVEVGVEEGLVLGRLEDADAVRADPEVDGAGSPLCVLPAKGRVRNVSTFCKLWS